MLSLLLAVALFVCRAAGRKTDRVPTPALTFAGRRSLCLSRGRTQNRSHAEACSHFCWPTLLGVDQFDLHDIGALDVEGGGADAQIELPVAQEALIVAQRHDLAAPFLHARRPFAQSAGVILAESEGTREFQARALGFVAEASQRRQHAAREDIMTDEVAA